MHFGEMCEEVNTCAPMLYGLLNGLKAAKTETKDPLPRDPTNISEGLRLSRRFSIILELRKGVTNFPASLVPFYTPTA